jgi:pantothenate kinase type III
MNVILTGGLSSLISPKLDRKHHLAPQLTLDGMRLIESLN